MPSSEEQRQKQAKEQGGRDRGSQKRGGLGGRDGKSGKGESKQTVAEIKTEEYDEFIKACVTSHAAWLSLPLLNLSASLSLSPAYLSLALLSLLILILLLSPSNWIPHISAPLVLLIPLQNTLQCIAEAKRSRGISGAGGGRGGDTVQWLIFWMAWIAAGWVGELVRVFKPGYGPVWEVGKVGVGVVFGGPWFGRAAMVPGKPSSKLAEAEQREAAEQAKAEKPAQEAAKKQAGTGRKEKDEAKARAKAKAKARAKEQTKE